MVVVYGTKHYGRANGYTRHSVCDQCGAFGPLSSYDAVAYFTLYMIPLIPLGRRRVIDACPSCKMHREMSLSTYRKLHEEQLVQAVAGLKDQPHDPEAVVNAIGAYIHAGEFENVKAMAPALAAEHRTNSDVQAAIASAYHYLGMEADAEPFYQQAVRLQDNAANREALAVNLILQGRPDEARPLLDHVLASDDAKSAGILYVLVEAYQDTGEHDTALAILDQIEAVNPDARDDSEHVQLRTTSEEARTERRPIPSVLLRAPQGVQPLKSGSPHWLPALVPLSIVAGLFAWYMTATIQRGNARAVWLVSGTFAPYTAVINGADYAMAPFTTRQIRLPEGAIDVSIQGTTFAIPDQKLEYRTPFWSRAFKSPVAVLNPDGLALLVEAHTTYSANPVEIQEDTFTVHLGESFYILDDVDYPFEPFPNELQLSTSQSLVRKTALSNFEPETADSALQAVVANADAGQLLPLVSRRARFEPEDETTLFLMYTLGSAEDPEETISLLGSGLDHRPVLVHWHRMYQTAAQSHRDGNRLFEQYADLVRQEPDDPYLKYLLGRVTDDPDAARTLFLEAENGPTPIGLGFYAIGYASLCRGEFEDAVALLDKAVGILPDQHLFASLHDTCRLAAGRIDELLAEVLEARAQDPLDFALQRAEVKLLAMSGRAEQAGEAAGIYLDALVDEIAAEERERIRRLLESVVFYVEGDMGAYVESGRDAIEAEPYIRALYESDVASAASYLEEASRTAFSDYLLLYCVAVSSGKSGENTGAYFQKALELLRQGDKDNQLAAAMLDGGEAVTREGLESLLMLPQEKRILAVSLGLRIPALQDHCFSVARRHNFDPEFPQLLLARIMGPQRTPH